MDKNKLKAFHFEDPFRARREESKYCSPDTKREDLRILFIEALFDFMMKIIHQDSPRFSLEIYGCVITTKI